MPPEHDIHTLYSVHFTKLRPHVLRIMQDTLTQLSLGSPPCMRRSHDRSSRTHETCTDSDIQGTLKLRSKRNVQEVQEIERCACEVHVKKTEAAVAVHRIVSVMPMAGRSHSDGCVHDSGNDSLLLLGEYIETVLLSLRARQVAPMV